jgi:hypothetical protein
MTMKTAIHARPDGVAAAIGCCGVPTPIAAAVGGAF